MKKLITLIVTILPSLVTFAQVSKDVMQSEIKLLTEKVKILQFENSQMKFEINTLNNKLSLVVKGIDSLINQTQVNLNTINQTNQKLTKSETNSNKRISAVDESLSKKSLYGIIGVIIAILGSGIIYWLLSKRQKNHKENLDKIQNETINSINELTQEGAKLDVQLFDVIEKQLKVADKLNATEPSTDHTFHKNSANELQRIANYANTLPPESQEAIALQGSLGRLRNYFNASDYEITDFTGKDYDERIPMRMRETIFDESIEVGKEIVVKTWEPQIKFKNDIIQQAKIDTKYNK